MTSTTANGARAAKNEPREICGPFGRGAPVGHWGGGFFVARRMDATRTDLAPIVVLQRAFGVDAAALARAAVWRRAHPHANMPTLVDHALDDTDQERTRHNAWIAYAAVPAVIIERVLGVHPVPVVLAWAMELVDVMVQHAKSALDTVHTVHTVHTVELRPAFSDLLVTREGSLLVLTPPSLAHTGRSALLRTSRFDSSLRAPELGLLKHAPFATQLDVFAAGAFVRLMLRHKESEPRRDISARTAQLVQRACGPLGARHESLDELAHDLRACIDEFPAVTAAERAHAVHTFARAAIENAEKELQE